jgi:regulator of nucleoside diphosphate kinase
MHSFTPITVTTRDKSRLLQVVDCFAAKRHGVLVEFLRGELARASVIASEDAPRQLVTMNSRVRYRDNVEAAIVKASLVYPGEEDPWLGRLSVLNMAGTALLGLCAGQTMDWQTLDGCRKSVTLLDVLFQPEAAGRIDL